MTCHVDQRRVGHRRDHRGGGAGRRHEGNGRRVHASEVTDLLDGTRELGTGDEDDVLSSIARPRAGCGPTARRTGRPRRARRAVRSTARAGARRPGRRRRPSSGPAAAARRAGRRARRGPPRRSLAACHAMRANRRRSPSGAARSADRRAPAGVPRSARARRASSAAVRAPRRSRRRRARRTPRGPGRRGRHGARRWSRADRRPRALDRARHAARRMRSSIAAWRANRASMPSDPSRRAALSSLWTTRSAPSSSPIPLTSGASTELSAAARVRSIHANTSAARRWRATAESPTRPSSAPCPEASIRSSVDGSAARWLARSTSPAAGPADHGVGPTRGRCRQRPGEVTLESCEERCAGSEPVGAAEGVDGGAVAPQGEGDPAGCEVGVDRLGREACADERRRGAVGVSEILGGDRAGCQPSLDRDEARLAGPRHPTVAAEAFGRPGRPLRPRRSRRPAAASDGRSGARPRRR